MSPLCRPAGPTGSGGARRPSGGCPAVCHPASEGSHTPPPPGLPARRRDSVRGPQSEPGQPPPGRTGGRGRLGARTRKPERRVPRASSSWGGRWCAAWGWGGHAPLSLSPGPPIQRAWLKATFVWPTTPHSPSPPHPQPHTLLSGSRCSLGGSNRSVSSRPCLEATASSRAACDRNRDRGVPSVAEPRVGLNHRAALCCVSRGLGRRGRGVQGGSARSRCRNGRRAGPKGPSAPQTLKTERPKSGTACPQPLQEKREVEFLFS